MKPTQINYAVTRLDEITRDKTAALEEKFSTPAKILTVADLVKGIKNGSVKPRTEYLTNDVHRHSYVSSVFDLSGLEPKFDGKGYAKAVKPLQDEYTKIKDKLVLGDASEALKLIEAFAAKTF